MSRNKTGFNYLDELSEEEFHDVVKRTREYWNALTPEQRVEHLDVYYTAIREKIKSKGGLITQEQAIKEIINIDVPKNNEETIASLEEGGYFHLANKLRAKRAGVDYISTDELYILKEPDNIEVFVEPGDEKYFLGPAAVVVQEKDKEKEKEEEKEEAS